MHQSYTHAHTHTHEAHTACTHIHDWCHTWCNDGLDLNDVMCMQTWSCQKIGNTYLTSVYWTLFPPPFPPPGYRAELPIACVTSWHLNHAELFRLKKTKTFLPEHPFFLHKQDLSVMMMHAQNQQAITCSSRPTHCSVPSVCPRSFLAGYIVSHAALKVKHHTPVSAAARPRPVPSRSPNKLH
jgi:hypothetical protein